MHVWVPYTLITPHRDEFVHVSLTARNKTGFALSQPPVLLHPLFHRFFIFQLQIFLVGYSFFLFVKVPQSGDSKVTFSVIESSCHLLLAV